MNAMWPIRRDDKVVGYIWANELFDDVRLQMRKLDWSVMVVGLGIILVLVLLLSRSFGRDVDTVKSGLQRIQYDLHTPLPKLKGEIGEIAQSANAMANSLREARSFIENVLNSISDGVITVDNDGIVTMLNLAAQRIVELDPQTTPNRPYRDAITDVPFSSPILYTLSTGIHRTGFEIDYPVRDGICHVSTSSSVIRNADGESLGVAAFIRDMTEKKQMQRHMERAEQLASPGEPVAGCRP